MSEWKPSACILCECNCGIEVQVEDRRFVKIRGDKAHPHSQGYACEKAHRLDHYQNGRDRLTSPLRRRPDGSFEEIDWDTAISEVAQRLGALRDEFGGTSIFYYGGGGQGNHLPGAYAQATRRALGMRYRSNALAQEKTGEFWVAAKMFGAYKRADFHHCDVALFIGKNPWHSHSIARARVVLKEIAKDPKRHMIVIDPRRTETAKLADLHLQVRPGTDAWLVSALAAAIVEGGYVDAAFLEAHTQGGEALIEVLKRVPIAAHCEKAGVPEAQLREAARLIGEAERLATMEDLGVQMNRHSTLVSYLHHMISGLTGHFGRPGTSYVPTALVSLVGTGGKKDRFSPVTGARIIGGLVPCNSIAEEILTDHPKRFRGMIVEAVNPAHSLADTTKMREALEALDTLVVIDVAMSETARLADYVLPASSQYEKAEATFFNFEFPTNAFHLRRRLLEPLEGTLPEAEIHTRLVEALGLLDETLYAPLRAAAQKGRLEFGAAFFQKVMPDPTLMGLAPCILYRTLGETLPAGLAEGAVLWGASFQYAMSTLGSINRAGFAGPPPVAGDALFQALLDTPTGVIFSVDGWADSFERVRTPSRRIELEIPELLEVLASLSEAEPEARPERFPFVLAAGERRGTTANTIIRDPDWRRKDSEGALRMSPADAEALGVGSGDRVRLSTKAGSAVVVLEVSDTMQAGHISLPNGLGVDYGEERVGVAPNELTSLEDRDPIAGTPWHKHVPARVEPL